MTGLYKNKYRIASARHPAWNYGWNAAYFVTICTKDRVCWFGQIVETQDFASLQDLASLQNVASPQGIAPLPHEPQMKLSEMGEIAHQCWLEIPQHFPFVKLGNHIIMPNHVHGIVIIDKPDDGFGENHDLHNVETQNLASLQDVASLPSKPSETNKPKNQFGPQSKNLASIIRGFKTGITKNARRIAPEFAWQPRYHDHIIRNEKSYYHISEYIVNNPPKWTEDEFYAP